MIFINKELIHIRSLKDISIICYSGFTLQQLQTQSDIYIDKILSLITYFENISCSSNLANSLMCASKYAGKRTGASATILILFIPISIVANDGINIVKSTP